MKVAPIKNLGFRSLQVLEHLGQIARFALSIVSSLLVRPYRIRRLVNDIYDAGVLSLPVVCLSGAVVGGTLSLLGYTTLVRFGAEEALGALVGLSVIRELGPVLTALLVTGRAGSAIAAEIATMVTTEQLDGLRMMSVDPVDFIATPKAAAMVLAMPLLSALFIVFGSFGGWLIGVQVLGIDHGAYLGGLESAIDFSDDVLGSLVKALVFGVLVGLIATFRGYTSAPNVEGVSRATTGAVVQASVGTLIIDYFITALWGV